MNPLLNAYNYQIKKLTEEINFLKNQNISLLSYLNEDFDYPSGYEIAQGPSGNQLPPGVNPLEIPGQQNNPWTFPGSETFNRPGFGGRAKYLQRLWNKFRQGLASGDPQAIYNDYLRWNFNLIQRILENMTVEQWSRIVQYVRDNNIDLNSMTLEQIYRWFDSPPIRAIHAPGNFRRFGRMIKKAATWAYNNKFVRWSFIILTLTALGYRVWGFNSQEEFDAALQEWINSGSQDPPPWANPDIGNWDDLPEPDPNFIPQGDALQPSTEPELPSMLPPSNPSPIAPQLPGGGGGGLGARPIDPTQMGM